MPICNAYFHLQINWKEGKSSFWVGRSPSFKCIIKIIFFPGNKNVIAFLPRCTLESRIYIIVAYFLSIYSFPKILWIFFSFVLLFFIQAICTYFLVKLHDVCVNVSLKDRIAREHSIVSETLLFYIRLIGKQGN